jgi:hypothetical protein
MSGGAIAATGGFTSNGKLQACVNEEGTLKLLKAGKKCKRGQKTVAWSQTGPAGANGATGASGVNGANGAAGAAGTAGRNGFANVVVRTTQSFSGGFNSQRAVCEPGEVATGGGVEYADGHSQGGTSIADSGPLNEERRVPEEGETPTGWHATFVSTGTPQPVTWFVVCASP